LYLKIIYHLLFNTSASFSERVQSYIREKGWALNVFVLTDPPEKFFANATMLLNELFGLQVGMTWGQFYLGKYVECKLTLILDIYYIVFGIGL
jgi:hypothetical protein